MKQIALSLFVIASSGAYVLDQAAKPPAGDMIDMGSAVNAAGDSVSQPLGPVTAPVAAATPPALRAPELPRPGVRIEPTATPPATVGRETTAAIASPVPQPPAAAKLAVLEKPPVTRSQTPTASLPSVPQTLGPPPQQTPGHLIADAAPQAGSFAITPAV
ncbi:FMN-binding protein, partial [Mesorhizobium sp. M7A.F.Ca.US.001.04.2.1]